MPSHNKGKLLSWIGYWPISMTWTLINDPFVRILKLIQERFNSVYTLMTNKMFKGIDID